MIAIQQNLSKQLTISFTVVLYANTKFVSDFRLYLVSVMSKVFTEQID